MSVRRGVIYSGEELRRFIAEASRDADRYRDRPRSAGYREAIARMLYWAAVEERIPETEIERRKADWLAERARLANS